ncbi:MAG: 3-deoxy-D-manno-octulosonic acid transferase [Micavibrio sp.]|nr:MAG: 3-deoxy-D-manno-octulosonic acid transferase [Micavibrio sp.]
MLKMYRTLMAAGEPVLTRILERRRLKGKEDTMRIGERKGQPGRQRPEGQLVWIHAASVGEAQSALIVIDALLSKNESMHALVTTGTVTSAKMMAKNLPERAFHQFYPLDHPDWVDSFLSHWHPDLVLWMESELWPNMLAEIKDRNILAVLVNARLSNKSYRLWKLSGGNARKILETFSLVLAQTEKDARLYQSLKASHVITTDNLKYSAKPLPFDEESLSNLSAMCGRRPLWLYASTHDGEEAMACRIHQVLQNTIPDLLTIIVPRHPERRKDIVATCAEHNLRTCLRGDSHALPGNEDEIYIADTLGELGLFYRLSPIACIGRCFSNDGGGGHNPIEAMQLNCAVLFGPHVQNLQEIYGEIDLEQSALRVGNETEFIETLRYLLENPKALHEIQNRALSFAQDKSNVLDRIMQALKPVFEQSGITKEAA